ncbi:MAG: hypothetical protein ACE5FS_10515 [Paracoccaceae bacterium]
MAFQDYKKRLAKVKTWEKNCQKAEKQITARTESVRKIALGLEDKIRKDSVLFKGYTKHIYQLTGEWYKLAGQIIDLQDKLKKAE